MHVASQPQPPEPQVGVVIMLEPDEVATLMSVLDQHLSSRGEECLYTQLYHLGHRKNSGLSLLLHHHQPCPAFKRPKLNL